MNIWEVLILCASTFLLLFGLSTFFILMKERITNGKMGLDNIGYKKKPFTYFIILSTIQYYNTIPFLNRNTVTYLGIFIIIIVTCGSVIIVLEYAK